MQIRGGYPTGVPVELNVDELPLLQVMGAGRVEVVPDTVVITLGVSTRAEQAATAYQQTAAVINQVVRALTEMGIARDQLQTQQVNLQPIYYEERLVGYTGSSTLRVTLRDLDQAGPVIDRAVAAGANTVHGVSFEVRDEAAHEAAALTQAVQDAQRQAAQLARSLGIRLGPVWRVQTEAVPVPVMPAFARAVAVEAIPILPGTLTLTRQVRLEYLIQQG